MKQEEGAIREELRSFVARFQTLTPDEVSAIVDNLVVKRYPKGTMLVEAGEVSRACYFILRGCLRQSRLVDGSEKTVAFFTEDQAVTLFSSYTNQTPSESYLVCLEDSVLIVGALEQEAEMYRQFPKLALITRMMMEQDLGRIQDAHSDFITSSPTERYLHLLRNRPGLLQRVPQHQLASYIGVTPESLSRIRKRITKHQPA